jgi:hypothetical protein
LAWARSNNLDGLPQFTTPPSVRARKVYRRRVEAFRPRRIAPGSKIVINAQAEAARRAAMQHPAQTATKGGRGKEKWCGWPPSFRKSDEAEQERLQRRLRRMLRRRARQLGLELSPPQQTREQASASGQRRGVGSARSRTSHDHAQDEAAYPA